MGIYERLGRKRPTPKGAPEPAATPATTPASAPIVTVPPPPVPDRKSSAVKVPSASPPESTPPTTVVASNAGTTVGRKLAALKLSAAAAQATAAPSTATKPTPLGKASVAIPKPPPGVDLGLQREISQLLMDDNYAQIAMRDLMKRLKLKTADEVRKRAELSEVRKLKELDERRIKRLKELLSRHGWPGKSLVGEQGSHEVWLIVQHADHDRSFQKYALKLMAEAVAKKEASEQDFAYLTDRVRCGENQRQIYGTQLHTINGEPTPKPIEDEANVDARRRQIGLAPMAEYLRHAREEYKKRRHR